MGWGWGSTFADYMLVHHFPGKLKKFSPFLFENPGSAPVCLGLGPRVQRTKVNIHRPVEYNYYVRYVSLVAHTHRRMGTLWLGGGQRG